MTELERYVGDWVGEAKKTPQDREFHFNYRLEWFDAGQKMVKMTITQEFADGEKRLMWEGFKGWHPVREVVYYYGFSPSGRAGAGTLRKDGNDLLTEYEGFDVRGNGVELRDVFTPIDADSFRSETFIKREGIWQKINTETWTRRK